MLSKKIKKFLAEEEIEKNNKAMRQKIAEVLLKEGVSSESSFLEFMSVYEDDEFYGSEGLIINVGDDLLDYDNSLTKHFRNKYNIARNYLPLFNLEVDDYLFYDVNNDNVTLVEANKIEEFRNNKILPNWKTFDDFLNYFFEFE